MSSSVHSVYLTDDQYDTPDTDEQMMYDVDDENVSNLEKTINKIGMGPYQWSLLSLCGFGWMADNMWLQAVAIILPRVQDHYSVSDQSVGWLSTSTFFGMMLGAVGWGTCSDLLGRTTAFNATLLLTSVFGVVASTLANSFKTLCLSLFFLGTAIGGSMPTDGTLFLENVPKRKQYLLTLLSVFFSFGAVLSAIIGIVIIPSRSCPDPTSTGSTSCDVETQNLGWRYLLGILSGITLVMFIARIFFFTLHESPRYLVNTGRPAEAVHALQSITSFNGMTMKLGIKDVDDQPPVSTIEQDGNSLQQKLSQMLMSSSTERAQHNGTPNSDPSPPISYQSTSSSAEAPLSGGDYTFQTPVAEIAPTFPPPPSRRQSTVIPPSRRLSTVSQISQRSPTLNRFIRKWIKEPLEVWWEKILSLLTDEWRKTTLLIWAAWCLMSLAYTMFNVYLPKLLESRLGDVVTGESSGMEGRKRAMWDVVVFTLGGCPGALLGAWMIETRLGRRLSLALSTFATALFCAIFGYVSSQWAVTASSMAISLAVTTMWAVLYGMTPEMFVPKVRGTACGTASALSRVGGMIAPLLGGSLLVVDTSLPVYTAVGIFIAAGICVLLLDDDAASTRREQKSSGRGSYTRLSNA
ncbi:hypothetical protein FRC03_003731 [Tulasnella sp. 419]|nr:hypothetical protein FRC03_003731 [Tulasnella sp. 419]